MPAKKIDKKLVAFTCPFCREAEPTGQEYTRQLQARCLQDDHIALSEIGQFHTIGDYGVTKDDLKAIDCYIRSVDLGSAEACIGIAHCYTKGNGVAIDRVRAALFERVGALRGDIMARQHIGSTE